MIPVIYICCRCRSFRNSVVVCPVSIFTTKPRQRRGRFMRTRRKVNENLVPEHIKSRNSGPHRKLSPPLESTICNAYECGDAYRKVVCGVWLDNERAREWVVRTIGWVTRLWFGRFPFQDKCWPNVDQCVRMSPRSRPLYPQGRPSGSPKPLPRRCTSCSSAKSTRVGRPALLSVRYSLPRRPVLRIAFFWHWPPTPPPRNNCFGRSIRVQVDVCTTSHIYMHVQCSIQEDRSISATTEFRWKNKPGLGSR